MVTLTENNNPQIKNKLIKHAMVISISMILGLLIGLIAHAFGDRIAQPVIDATSMVVGLFLRLIKMIVAPLVFSTLASGIGNVQDTKTIKRVGLRVMLWFIATSFIALVIGMIAANLIHPGLHFTDKLPTATIPHSSYHFDLYSFILHIVPDSVIAAMAQNNILQLVVFSTMFGLAISQLPERSCQLVREGTEGLAKIMLKITDMVMKTIPLVVFCSLVSIAARNGWEVIASYGLLLIEFYIVILILCAILIAAGYLMIGKKVFSLTAYIAEPVLVGFATASSESAFPRLLEQLEAFGVSPRIAGFVVPLGYSFNLTGTMMFISFAAIFIAQAYGIQMPIEKQMAMLLVMMISSKGIAGIPRASLVMLAAVMPGFGIPEAGLLLIVGIDQFLDMARTATSVLGNGIAAAVADQWDSSADPKETSSSSV